MTTTTAFSVYESFNARSLEPREVAATFVPPRQFSVLTGNIHTLVLGPRGSGKTTLLKMLQPEAIDYWAHPNKDEYLRTLPFAGVFVGTDIAWREQLRVLERVSSSRPIAELVATAAFVTQVLRALVRSTHYLRSDSAQAFRLDLKRSAEVDLAASVGETWGLESDIPSLAALELSLTSRAVKLGQLATSLSFSERFPSADDVLSQHSYISLDMVDAVEYLFDALRAHADVYPKKWAVLVDELELAPPSIRDRLLRYLRSKSSDERLLFKLSLTPHSAGFSGLTGVDAPQVGQDYESVFLTHSHKADNYEFSRDLVSSLLVRRGFGDQTPSVLFGPSEFDSGRREQSEFRQEYSSPSGPGYKRLASLARKDRSFADYLSERHIDLEHLSAMKEDQRAADVRKLRAIVAVRDTYRRSDAERGPVVRPRKNPPIYAGETNLYAICEGNPRLLIGITLSLINAGLVKPKGIRRNFQVRSFHDASRRFRNRLRTVPYAPDGAEPAPSGVLELLDTIGAYFFRRVVKEPFNPEPPLSFSVGRDIPEHTHRALADALNLGALIYMPREGDPEMIDTLYDRRFRLSYLLAMWHRLPLVTGRDIKLSSILMSEPLSTAQQTFLEIE